MCTIEKSIMVRQRKEKGTNHRLKQPDRSGPDASQETLFEIAEKCGLLKAQQERQTGLDGSSQAYKTQNAAAVSGEASEEDEVLVGRLGDAVLWSISLTMLHFTLDVLVTHQYAVEIIWPTLMTRSVKAFPSISFALCPHERD